LLFWILLLFLLAFYFIELFFIVLCFVILPLFSLIEGFLLIFKCYVIVLLLAYKMLGWHRARLLLLC